jgi:hypothetical protein
VGILESFLDSKLPIKEGGDSGWKRCTFVDEEHFFADLPLPVDEVTLIKMVQLKPDEQEAEQAIIFKTLEIRHLFLHACACKAGIQDPLLLTTT